MTRLILTWLAAAATATLYSQTAEIKGPLTGRLQEVPVWKADSDQVRLSAEGRVKSLPELAEDALPGWEADDDGNSYLLLRVAAEGAAGLRLHFENFRVPEGARVFVYGLDGSGQVTNVRGPYTGAGILEDGGFWTLALQGEQAVIEIQTPGPGLESLPFTLREVGVLDQVEESDLRPETAAQGEVTARTSWINGFAVDHTVRDGVAYVEGDIVLGPANELLEAPADAEKTSARDAFAINGSNYRWPGGVVPYAINPVLPNQQRVLDAVAHWNTNLSGSLQLVPRTNQTAYLYFTTSSGCSSYVGMQGNAQSVWLGDSCSTGNTIHEIGHAIGLWHEQTRTDRDSFVKINYANISSSATFNFDKQSGTALNAYDYNSIMHYGAYAFSVNGLPTIETIPPGIPIGQRSGLSAGDIDGARKLYPGTAPAPTPTPTPTPTTPPPPPPPAPATVQVTLATNPAGLKLVVDGVTVTAPRTFTWAVGSLHTLSANNQASAGTKYTFSSWSNGGAQSQSYKTPTANAQVVASYSVRHRVNVKSSSRDGSVTIAPSSNDGFYPANSVVTITATPASGACSVANWGGVTANPSNVLKLTVNKEYDITANFQTGALSVSSTTLNAGFWGGTLAVGITANSGCSWTARTDTPWIVVTPAAGKNSANVSVMVLFNRMGTPRTGTVTIGGNTVTINQAGY